MKTCKKHFWEDKHYAFFQNRDCEYFPCHAINDIATFNCLFCYCPLYAMGKNCGGNWTVLDNGVKDCSACVIPHQRENYGLIVDKLTAINKIVE